MWLKAVRWRLFFPEPEKLRRRGLHEALYIGYMANTILPLRVGEVVRAFVAAETEQVSKSTTLATVLIEKVLDLGTMALILFAARADLPGPAGLGALRGVPERHRAGDRGCLHRLRAGGAGACDPARGVVRGSGSRR